MDKEKELRIVDLYVNENLGVRGITQELYLSTPTILTILHKYGVIRSQVEAQRLAADQKHKALDAQLRQLYLDEKLGIKRISQRFGLPHSLVQRRLKRMGILRTKSEAVNLAYQMGRHTPSAWAKRGEQSPSWKGGRRLTKDGYVLVYEPSHPGAYILEHRLVMEKKLGRALLSNEIVHHINGVRDDNRRENLVVLSSNNHPHRTLLKITQEKVRELEGLINKMPRF